jgi:two-component system response regulator (stage 0 sporulation protein F)
VVQSGHIDARDIYLVRDRDFYPTCVGGSLFQGILYAGTMATILIIDDEESVRALLRSVLEAAGYEVTEAANGRQGLERYRQRPTDLVIVDMLMPVMSGLDMLLDLTREFLHAKVIAISGAGGEQNVLDVAKLLGARQTLQKPFSMPQLLQAVRYELDH